MLAITMSNMVKPMNSKELANLYMVTKEVFIAWLKPIREKLGPQVGRMWTIKQVQMMIDHFGPPPSYD